MAFGSIFTSSASGSWQPTGDGDRRAQSSRQRSGNSSAAEFRRGVHRRACFADDHVAQGGCPGFISPHNLRQRIARILPAGRAVSDRHTMDTPNACESSASSFAFGCRGFLLGFGQVDHARYPARGRSRPPPQPCSPCGMPGSTGPWPTFALDGRLHEQRLEVQGKHMYGGLLSLVRQVIAQFRIQGRRDKPGIGVLAGGHHVLGGDAACMG